MAKIILNVTTDIKQSKAQLESLSKTVKSIATSLSSVKVDPNLTAQIKSLSDYYKSLSKVVEKNTKVNYNNEIQELKRQKALEESTRATLRREKAEIDLARSQEKNTNQTKKSTQANKEHKESLGTMIPQIAKWQVAMTAVMKPLQLMRQALEDVNETLVETEKRIIALRRVAGQAANADELYALAKKYGQTFENVADVTENFAKSGYDWADAIKAAEAALIAMNVAELDAEQSSEGLIAIMKQFDKEVEDLNYIIGLLNKTSDNAAVTTEELLIALQKTGSTAKNAGLELNETVALITALSEGTAASGQNIGNALRSLFIFTSDQKALETFAGLSDAMAETVKNYRAGQSSILEVWKGLGDELGRMEGKKGLLSDLFGRTDLNSDLAAELTQIEDQFAEIYGTAGNYRQNYFIALLDNLDEVEEALGEMHDVEQYSQQENLLYMETYEAKVNSLKAAWQSLANDEQGFLSMKKSLADLGGALLRLVDIFGGLRTVLAAVSTIALALFGKKMIHSIADMGKTMVTAFTSASGAAATLNKTLGIIGLVATAVSVAAGAIDSMIESARQREEELRQADQETVKSALEATEAYRKQAEAIANYTTRIEEVRAIKDNLSSSDDEVQSAESELLSIQNELVKSTNKYADSLDLVNGNLAEQLGYTKEISAEMLKQQAADWLEQNKLAIDIARGKVNDASSVSTGVVLGTADEEVWFTDWGDAENWGVFENEKMESFFNDIASQGSNVSVDSRQKNAGAIAGGIATALTLGIGAINGISEFFYVWGNAIQQGVYAIQDGKGAWEIIEAALGANLDTGSYLGEKEFGFTLGGTREEKIASLEKMLSYLNTNYQEKGISEDQATIIRNYLNNLLNSLNSDEYTEALDVVEQAEIWEAVYNGSMSYEEAMEKIYGITADTSKETAKLTNSLSDLSEGVMSELVEKFREIRNATKESYEYEEKKKAVLEAEKELENAMNDRTVRVFNTSTGMFEYRHNEKAIAEAEEDLEKARYEMEEAAYDEIEKLLGAGNVTNAAILSIIAKWTPDGEDDAWADGIKNFFKENYGIDLDKPTVTESLVGGYTGSIQIPENSAFFSNLQSMGVMTGASDNTATASYVTERGADSHDKYYYVNGVPIPQETAQTYTVAQLFENTDLFQN